MRIKVDSNTNLTGPGEIYAKEISSAGNAFAYAIYEHSKLPLRVLSLIHI